MHLKIFLKTCLRTLLFSLKASVFVSMVIFFGLTRNQLALCKIFSSARTNVVSVHVISGLMRVDKDGGGERAGRKLMVHSLEYSQ